MDGDQFTLIVAGVTLTGAVTDLENLSLKPGFFWCRVTLRQDIGPTLHLDDIPNAAAGEMHEAVKTVAVAVRRREHITRLLGDFPQEVERAKDWVSQSRQAFNQVIRRRGWLSHEFEGRRIDGIARVPPSWGC